MWKHAHCVVWGIPCALHFRFCYGGALIGDWWCGMFYDVSTSSNTPSLGLSLSPVHGALDEYDWRRWSLHAVTNYSSQWLPLDGLMCIVCVEQTALCHEMRDERIKIWSCAVCTSLIIIFLDENHCRRDDEVAICVQRLSHANTEQGLCHCREIWSCTDLCPLVRFQLLLTRTHPLSRCTKKCVFPFMTFSKYQKHLCLLPDCRAAPLYVPSSLLRQFFAP